MPDSDARYIALALVEAKVSLYVFWAIGICRSHLDFKQYTHICYIQKEWPCY